VASLKVASHLIELVRLSERGATGGALALATGGRPVMDVPSAIPIAPPSECDRSLAPTAACGRRRSASLCRQRATNRPVLVHLPAVPPQLVSRELSGPHQNAHGATMRVAVIVASELLNPRYLAVLIEEAASVSCHVVP
jgi:hypothetical protein